MKIANSIIYFKSLPEYYDKEYRWIKPNTVRIVLEEEDHLIQSSNIVYIQLQNTETGYIFSRLLTDITRFIHNDMIIYIFSWKHT